MWTEHTRQLIEQYINGQLTEAQAEELNKVPEEELLAFIQAHLEGGAAAIEDGQVEAAIVDPEKVQDLAERILAIDKPAPAPIKKIRRFAVIWWAAAMLIGAVLGFGGYALKQWQKEKDLDELSAKNQQQRFANDVAPPAGSKAVLTLANGNKVIIDSASIGVISQQGNINIIKSDSGKLTYDLIAKDTRTSEIEYNTLETGKGGQTSIVLADGTKVWLDASSSLRYPTSFPGKERRVEIQGQAYFEVARDASKPFYVEVDGMRVSVLGTSYNIKAYADEPTRIVTLVDGAVRVSMDKGKTLEMTPGDQVKVGPQGEMSKAAHADVDAALAWKNGYFIFNGSDMTTLLKEASRWYDVEVENLKTANPRFYGEVPRNTPLSDLLKAMELSGKVKFSIQGKKIIVLP
jgi:transmembrane sensor